MFLIRGRGVLSTCFESSETCTIQGCFTIKTSNRRHTGNPLNELGRFGVKGVDISPPLIMD